MENSFCVIIEMKLVGTQTKLEKNIQLINFIKKTTL